MTISHLRSNGSDRGVPRVLRYESVGPDGETPVPSASQFGCQMAAGFFLEAMSLVMLIIGCIKYRDCPAEPMVPIYLIGWHTFFKL